MYTVTEVLTPVTMKKMEAENLNITRPTRQRYFQKSMISFTGIEMAVFLSVMDGSFFLERNSFPLRKNKLS
jgi:hypothetical protein